MLVQNLNNPVYVDLVVGDLEQLPAKLAAVGKRAGSYSCWKKKQHVNNVSKISRNLLRKKASLIVLKADSIKTRIEASQLADRVGGLKADSSLSSPYSL